MLFCDLVGFTTISETRDPEQVRELLSQYFLASRTVLERYGGVVEKFIGDAVMAVWGTPVATEEDAERAVRAALDLVETVRSLGEEVGIATLRARVGVVSGEVAVTLGAQYEGMVAGDVVNTAARVQATAEPGSVLVDTTTRRLSAGAIGYDDAGVHALKGKSEVEQLWRATRVVSNVGGVQRVDGLEAPLTGRDAEVRALRELFHAVGERRVPRLVLVTGAAGVGKSRFGWEFEKYIDGLADSVYWHRGRSLSYGEGVAFWALAEAVRQRLAIGEEDQPEVAATKLVLGLERYVPDPDEREYVGVRVGRLLGIQHPGDTGAPLSRDDLFAGWRRFFESLAAAQPVVLLVEDAHHGDLGLLDFLDHLVDWARDLPIFVLVLARSEIEQVRPGFGTGRNRVTMPLDALDTASMEGLVDALVPGAPAVARAAIVRQAQGLPLFAVETVRSLIDRDVVRPVDGVYRVIGEVGALEVPDSLHALLAARLDALGTDARQLVTDAAVLGSSFSLEAIEAISGHPPDLVRATLADLVRREVLEVSADPLSPERGSYRFAQELLRQVAYDTLSRRDRKSRHLLVAGHLRRAFPGDGDEVVDVIARHYVDAIDAVEEDDAAEIRDLAVDALVRAAERADRTGAPSRAGESFLRGAELLEKTHVDDQRAASLLMRAGLARLDAGENSGALEVAVRAIEHLELRSETRELAQAQRIAGSALRRLGRHKEARQLLEASVSRLRIEPGADTVEAIGALAVLETFAGRDEAEGLGSEALALAQALGLGDRKVAGLLVSRAIWLSNAQRRAEAAMYLREAARLAERGGDLLNAGIAWLNLADVLAPDDPRASADAARQAVETARKGGVAFILHDSLGNLARALIECGEWDEAAAQIADDEVDPDDRRTWMVSVSRALIAGLRGDAETGALDLAVVAGWADSEDLQDRANLASVGAVVAYARGDRAEALSRAREALRIAGEFAIAGDDCRLAWPLAARCAHELGDVDAEREVLSALEGRLPGELSAIQRAEQLLIRARLATPQDADFEGAIAALRTQSTPYHLAHGLLDHAEHLFARGDAERAEVAVVEADAIADRLRCGPLLARSAELVKAAGARVSIGSPAAGS